MYSNRIRQPQAQLDSNTALALLSLFWVPFRTVYLKVQAQNR
jgi:hypothetical protein